MDGAAIALTAVTVIATTASDAHVDNVNCFIMLGHPVDGTEHGRIICIPRLVKHTHRPNAGARGDTDDAKLVIFGSQHTSDDSAVTIDIIIVVAAGAVAATDYVEVRLVDLHTRVDDSDVRVDALVYVVNPRGLAEEPADAAQPAGRYLRDVLDRGRAAHRGRSNYRLFLRDATEAGAIEALC